MMNTLPKFPAIAFLAVSIFVSGLIVDFVGAQNTDVGPAASRRPADLLLSPYLRFGRLTAEDGLSSDQTWDLGQDNQGFMWFVTPDGLNRYDGSDFKVYRRDPHDPNSLSHNIIRALFVDRLGVLWIGTWDSWSSGIYCAKSLASLMTLRIKGSSESSTLFFKCL